jgi:hypothetical protein
MSMSSSTQERYLFDMVNPSLVDDPSPNETYSSGATPETMATSEAARLSMCGRAGTKRRSVYELIRDDGPLDDKAIQARLMMAGSTERPRRRELQQAGLIEAAPGNGRTVRWRVTSTRPRRLGKTPEESWGLPSDGASGSQSLFVKKEG